jgi:hypothetical protein
MPWMHGRVEETHPEEEGGPPRWQHAIAWLPPKAVARKSEIKKS